MSFTFKNWVDKCGGPDKAGKALGVTPWAVRVWLRKEGHPKLSTMLKIVKITKGKLSLEKIMKETGKKI